MRQISHRLSIQTRGKGLYSIHRAVASRVAESGIRQGLLTLLIQHTSASLVIQENADPDVQTDLERFFSRLVPEGDPIYDHTAEGPDDMPAHVRAALTQTSLSIPLIEGALALGMWQGLEPASVGFVPRAETQWGAVLGARRAVWSSKQATRNNAMRPTAPQPSGLRPKSASALSLGSPRDHHWLRLASRIHRFLGATRDTKPTEAGSSVFEHRSGAQQRNIVLYLIGE